MKEKPKRPRGFAAMPREKQLAAAKKGGASVPAHKRSFSFDRDLAKSAGKAGGSVARVRDVSEEAQLSVGMEPLK